MGTENQGKRCENIPNPKRIVWILRYLANRFVLDPRERYVSIHKITIDVQRDMKKSQRDEDIKVCIEHLVKINQIEVVKLEDGLRYRISEYGYEKWNQTKEYLFQTIFL